MNCPSCGKAVRPEFQRCPYCRFPLADKGQRYPRKSKRASPARRPPSSPGLGFGEIWRMAVSSLRANKVRAALPVVGVIFGIATVVILMAISRGVRNDTARRFAELGPKGIVVVPGHVKMQKRNGDVKKVIPPPHPLPSSPITYEDVEYLKSKDEKGLIGAVTATIVGRVRAQNGEASIPVPLIGTDESYLKIREEGFRLRSGRFVENREGRQNECVVGMALLRDLFGKDVRPQDAVDAGYRINIVRELLAENPGPNKTITCTIVGVMEEAGKSISGNLDQRVYLPLRAANELYDNPEGRVSRLEILLNDASQVRDAVQQIERWLAERHGEEKVTVLEYQDLLARYDTLLKIQSALVVGVSLVSLLESVVAVLTIMYISVKERTREIGVRKATGATNEQVVLQFLLEAVLLSLLGGVIGAPLGIVSAKLIDRFTTLPAQVTLGSVLVAFFAIFFIGIVAGAYPAWRAAAVSPVEAMRAD